MNALKYFTPSLHAIFLRSSQKLSLSDPLFPLLDYLLDGLLSSSYEQSKLLEKKYFYRGYNFRRSFFLSHITGKMNLSNYLLESTNILKNVSIPIFGNGEILFIVDEMMQGKDFEHFKELHVPLKIIQILYKDLY